MWAALGCLVQPRAPRPAATVAARQATSPRPLASPSALQCSACPAPTNLTGLPACCSLTAAKLVAATTSSPLTVFPTSERSFISNRSSSLRRLKAPEACAQPPTAATAFCGPSSPLTPPAMAATTSTAVRRFTTVHRHNGPPRDGTTTVAAVAAATASLPGFSLPDFPALLPLQGPWGVWTGLVMAGALGTWSERTRLGKELSGALVSTLVGMLLANVGLLPPGAPELHTVYKYLLPLAIPMLLFAADLRRILSETGRLLVAYLLGSVATLGGSLAAMAAFPLGSFLGEEGWKVASALTARHIGGAVNYMAVSEALSLSPSTFGAGLAADDLILTLYFVTIYYLARSIPPDFTPGAGSRRAAPAEDAALGLLRSDGEEAAATAASAGAGVAARAAAAQPTAAAEAASGGGGGGGGGHGGGGGKVIAVPEGLAALSLSATICYVAVTAARTWGVPEQAITLITALTVALATLAPRLLAPLVPSAEGLAQLLMQIFYATIGASANVDLVVRTAPVLFLFSLLALGAHLGLLLAAGRAAGFSMRELLLASNANIGGPSTVAGMAAAKGWSSSVVPGILTSTLGYAIGTFLGVGLGYSALRHMG